MATKAELQQEADELGIGEQTKGLNKAEMEEIIENFKNLEVDEGEMNIVGTVPFEELTRTAISDEVIVWGDIALPDKTELNRSGYVVSDEKYAPKLEVNLEKLATQETINLIVQYRNSRGQRGGDELVKVVRDCIE